MGRGNNKLAKAEFDRDTAYYFRKIQRVPVLQVPYFDATNNGKHLSLPVESAVILWLYETYKLSEFIKIRMLKVKFESARVIFRSSSNIIQDQTQNSTCNNELDEDCPQLGRFAPSRLSILVEDTKQIICGMSSVARFMFKYAYMKLIANNPDDIRSKEFSQLLGYHGGCLQACAEVSTWTKFCEVDIIEGVGTVLQDLEQSSTSRNQSINFSEHLLRLEYHFEEPVKVHNYPKVADEHGVPVLPHTFAEGLDMLLSDLILYPCVNLLRQVYGPQLFKTFLNNVSTWLAKLDATFALDSSDKLTINGTRHVPKDPSKWGVPEVPKESLYKSDRTRFNPDSRVFTRQGDVEQALSFVSGAEIPLRAVTEVSTFLNWEDIPHLAHPEGGKLPENRRERKCQQLSSMIVEVMKVVEEKVKQNNSSSAPLRIADFCSGGGHVGILLAWLLGPKCQIILVENKEDSLRRAWERVEGLGLTNVLFYACNLDYFDLQFEIGVALHACGTATDLVVSKCTAAKASLICSPCCYGAIRSNHMLHYPRSREFSNTGISLKHYFTLAHASDQTHVVQNEKTEQGKLCMQVIDTDRCLNLQELGYHVYLGKMPETASPKNHIIIGISP